MSNSTEGEQVTEVSLELMHTDTYAEIKISKGPSANGKELGDSCQCIINELKDTAPHRESGRVSLNTLVVRVNLPKNGGIWAVDWLLHALFDSVIYWDTLEIITPGYDLANSTGCDTALRSLMHGDEDVIRAMALKHLAKTRLVYEGADMNVPWPWFDIVKLSRFQIRDLELHRTISSEQYVGLLQNAVTDTAGLSTDPSLTLRVQGLTQSVLSEGAGRLGPASEGPAKPQRLETVYLGRLDAGSRLWDAVHAGGAHESIRNLTVDVSASLITNGPGGGETIASIEEALCACGKLQSVKVRCREEHAEKLKTALSSWMGLVQAEGQAMPDGEREIVASRKLH